MRSLFLDNTGLINIVSCNREYIISEWVDIGKKAVLSDWNGLTILSMSCLIF